MVRVGVAVFLALVIPYLVEGARVKRRSQRSQPKPWSACGVKGASAGGNETSISIVNGKPATECAWRWHIGLQRTTLPNSIPWCGASLITNEWVLTAAHCVARWTFFFDAVAGRLEARVPGGKEQRRKVVQVIRHPDYAGSASGGYDYALLRLETPMEPDDCVGTVCLPTDGADVSPETSCWITGWGRVGIPGGKPDLLQEVSVNTISNADCGTKYDYNESQIKGEMLCAQGRTPEGLITDACTGDSGGPLVCEASGTWTLYGATSWGAGCAGEKHPGVWARISSVSSWIEETMAANAGEPTPDPGNCPFFTFRPNQDSSGHCQCNSRPVKEFCSTNGVDANCPTSEGPGGFRGTRFLQTCKDCACFPVAAQ